jgi:hypothetical protein
MIALVVGDWVVAGRAEEDLDYGEVTAVNGELVTVAWHGSEVSMTQSGFTDGELFTSLDGARSDYLERVEAAQHARHEGYDEPAYEVAS